MTKKLTRDWLQQRITDMESTRDDIPFGFDEDGNNELAAYKMALAAMNSEPYGFTDGDRRGMIYEPHYADRLNEPLPVYRHAQQPVVPDEKSMPNPLSMYAVDAVAAIAEVKGWNACRAAMIAAAPQEVPDVKAN